MKLIEPTYTSLDHLLSVGDILVDNQLGEYILRETRDKEFIFEPLDGTVGGYSGFHKTLDSITERTMKGIKSANSEEGRTISIYRAKDWDLKLVPKQK
jgi:hypothetical protein